MAAPPSQPTHITVRTEGQTVHVEIAGMQPFATGEARTVGVTIRQQSLAAGSEAAATHAQAPKSGSQDVMMIHERTSTHDQLVIDDESSDGEYQPDEKLDSGDEEVKGAARLGVERALPHSDDIVAARGGADMLTSTISLRDFHNSVLSIVARVIPEDNSAGELIANMLAKLVNPVHRPRIAKVLQGLIQQGRRPEEVYAYHTTAWSALRAELPNNALVTSEEFGLFINAFDRYTTPRKPAHFLVPHYHRAQLINRLWSTRTPAMLQDWTSLLRHVRSWFTEKTTLSDEDHATGLTLVVIYLYARHGGNLWLQGGWQDYAKRIHMEARFNSAILQQFFGHGILVSLAIQYYESNAELQKIPTHALAKVLQDLRSGAFEGYKDIFRPIKDAVEWYCEPDVEDFARRRQVAQNLEIMADEIAQGLSCQAWFALASKKDLHLA